MDDPFANVVIKLTDFVWEQLTQHAPAFLKKIKNRRSFNQAVDSYLSSYKRKYGTIRPIGMANSIPLEQIYTEVQFTTEDLRQIFSEYSIEQILRGDLRQSLDESKIQLIDGISAANQFNLMMVLGHPGGGKSTYLQRVGWECLRSHGIMERGQSGQPYYDHPLLPVLLELKRFRSDEKDAVIELIARELAESGFPQSVEMVEALLEAGKLLVLLDALDEVAQDRLDRVVEQAQTMVRRAPGCRFMVTCRTAFRRDYFKDFQDVTLLDFTDRQIDRFICNWFSTPEQKMEKISEGLIEELHKYERKSTLLLARSPILLSFLCVSYQGTMALSSNRAEIYREALDIYLKKWNAEKLKKEHTLQVHSTLPHESELAMLAQIAYQAMLDERFFLSKDEWLGGIRTFMADLVDRPKTLSTEDILVKIAVSQGLVVQRTDRNWSFSHLTLQEYLAAYHIDQNGLLAECVEAHLGVPRWREVFLILAGMKPGPLLLTMIRVANQKVNAADPSWSMWAERLNEWGRNSDFREDLELFVKVKVIGADLYLSLDPARDLDHPLAPELIAAIDLDHNRFRDHALDHALDRTLARARARARDNNSAPDKDHTGALVRALANLVAKDSRFSIQMKSELAALSPPRTVLQPAHDRTTRGLTWRGLPDLVSPKDVAQYFENLSLILQCKHSAARVPLRNEWQQVLEKII